MTNILDQAQNVQGVVSAARRRERWQQAEVKTSDPEKREQYREAIADLEARFPELEDVGPGGAEAFARERGHGTGARSPVHEGRRRTGGGGKARTGKKSPSSRTAPAGPKPKQPKPIPGITPGARRTAAQRKAAKGRPTPRVDRAIRQTGIPSAVDSTGSTAMAALGATVGLSLAYLVFSSAEIPGSGAAAFPRLVGGITRSLHRFLGLSDVFPSNVGGAGAIPAGMVEGRGGHLEPEGPAGSYNKRVEAGEAAGPPTPPRILRRERHQQAQQKRKAHR